MEFKEDPVFVSMSWLGIIFLFGFSVGFFWLYMEIEKHPGLLVMLIMTAGLATVMLALTISLSQTSVVIDAQGVRFIRFGKVKNSISWEECAEIGVYRYYYGRLVKIWFSPVPLTERQIYRKRPQYMIQLNLTDDVMQQIKKYVPDKPIRNNHLLPAQYR